MPSRSEVLGNVLSEGHPQTHGNPDYRDRTPLPSQPARPFVGTPLQLLRLFIAIELSDAARERLRGAVAVLRQQEVQGVRWVRPEGSHMTLKFLGYAPSAQVPAIVEALRTAVRGSVPFRLRIDGAGAFPNMRAPRVLWLGIAGDVEPLRVIQQRVERSLEDIGFPRETRAFSPHLTLGRISGQLSSQFLTTLSNGVARLQRLAPADLPVTGISLMESQLSPGGAEYRREASILLEGTLATPERA